MTVEDFIKKEIHHHGPMSVARFMELAVSHYYANRNPFGAEGDFTTAPEISQMFGEMLMAWVTVYWHQMGSPAPFALVECGPGRGTLMADGLRVTAGVFGAGNSLQTPKPSFHKAMQIHLIETSKALRVKQQEALEGFEVQWHDSIDTLPDGMPIILLANEFLDALPVRQYQFSKGRWHERMIGLDDKGALQFGLGPPAAVALSGKEGDIAEFSPARRQFVEKVCVRLREQGGIALFIDYGYEKGHGDTLQAVKNHKYVGALEDVGEADLTAHVDFAALRDIPGVSIHGPVRQGEFLLMGGIANRADFLKKDATPQQAGMIDAALKRLTGPHEMGELFKVMAFSDGKVDAGF